MQKLGVELPPWLYQWVADEAHRTGKRKSQVVAAALALLHDQRQARHP